MALLGSSEFEDDEEDDEESKREERLLMLDKCHAFMRKIASEEADWLDTSTMEMALCMSWQVILFAFLFFYLLLTHAL